MSRRHGYLTIVRSGDSTAYARANAISVTDGVATFTISGVDYSFPVETGAAAATDALITVADGVASFATGGYTYSFPVGTAA